MPNTLLTLSAVTKEALRVLKNNLAMAKGVNKQYSDRFAKSGAKIGNSIDIRKPNRYVVSDGATLVVQDTVEETVTLELDKQKHVGMNFTSADLTLSMDNFSDRIIKPAMAALANQVDYDLTGLMDQVFQSVGTPGTTMTDLSVALAAGRKLKEAGCPVDDALCMLIDAASEASVVNGLSGKFHSSTQVSKQYEKGVMGLAAGFKWKMDQNIRNHTVGAFAGTPLVNGAAQSGSTLVTDGWTSGSSTLNKGDVFTVAGVYAVNPQNRQSTGQLQDFVVTAQISDSSGAKTIAISPAIVASGAKQTVSNAPADNAAITVKGSASTAYPQNLAFHKDAFVLGCADLELPGGEDMASRAVDKDAGLSIRLVRSYDINNDKFPCRLDLLYGLTSVYPELACRAWG